MIIFQSIGVLICLFYYFEFFKNKASVYFQFAPIACIIIVDIFIYKIVIFSSSKTLGFVLEVFERNDSLKIFLTSPLTSFERLL